jgi:protein-S-isoprenylcysteine O-methyltransferase Ste14
VAFCARLRADPRVTLVQSPVTLVDDWSPDQYAALYADVGAAYATMPMVREFFITSAALIMAAVFGAFVLARVVLVQMLGLVLLPAHSRFRLVVAGGLYATALIIFWWSLRTSWQRRLAVAFSPVVSEHLVQTGPYRWVRHPIYLAYLLAWLAGGIGIGTWWAWIVLPTMGAQYLHAISYEENQFLTGPLAADYHAYRSRTGMLFPRLLTRQATE